MKKWYICIPALLLICCMMLIPLGKVGADVGNFNDYDGGSDWGGSDWGGSDWGDSDWDSGNSGGWVSSGSSSDDDVDFVIVAIVVGVIILVSVVSGLKKHGSSGAPSTYAPPPTQVPDNTNAIVPAITQIDPGFTAEGFVSYTKEVFITLQEAWTARDWAKIRPFEKEEIFKLHEKQLDEYKRMGRINVIERINVNKAYLHRYTRTAKSEFLTVYMQVRMVDYIKDEKTNAVLKGDPNKDCHLAYLLTFTRTNGVKTQTDNNQSNIVACPHCGAPTSITSAGQCEYCGFIVTTGEYGWVLSDMERVRPGMDVQGNGVSIHDDPSNKE